MTLFQIAVLPFHLCLLSSKGSVTEEEMPALEHDSGHPSFNFSKSRCVTKSQLCKKHTVHFLKKHHAVFRTFIQYLRFKTLS